MFFFFYFHFNYENGTVFSTCILFPKVCIEICEKTFIGFLFTLLPSQTSETRK